MMLSRTVGRMDAAVERTGMYLQRVLESIITSCDYSDSKCDSKLMTYLWISCIGRVRRQRSATCDPHASVPS